MTNHRIGQARAPRSPPPALPALRTRFIGRERELEELLEMLASTRLVTLTGAAGCGKSRLALECGAAFYDRHGGEAILVELAPLSDPTLVAQSVARAAGIPEQKERTALEVLVESLVDRPMLVILDNCEHLLESCAHLAAALLATTGTRVLATSREPLSVTGEQLYPTVPLPLPPEGCPASEIGHYDAVRLFADRARATLPDFSLSARNAPTVAAICRRLEGIPLAIELAAARVHVLSVTQIAERLAGHGELLAIRATAMETHHRTLRGALDWSHDLLSGSEQRLLRRLAVFLGGCSLDLVEQICAGEGVAQTEILSLLSSLVRRSLVVADTLGSNEARYRLLEPIREYALEKLREAGEYERLRDRHLDVYLVQVAEIAQRVKGDDQQRWLDWLEVEKGNLRAALIRAREVGRIEDGLRLGCTLYDFWTIRDLVTEGNEVMQRLLARLDRRVSMGTAANALSIATNLASFRGDRTAQRAYARQAAALETREAEIDADSLSWLVAAQMMGARAEGDVERDFELGSRLVDLARGFRDPHRLAISLTICSSAAMAAGRYDVAHAWLDEGLPMLRELGDPYRIGMALNYSGDLARCENDYVGALHFYEESVTTLRRIDARRDLASLMYNRGLTRLRLGDTNGARDDLRESVRLHREQNNRPGLAECLIGFAALALHDERPHTAARLLAAAAALGGAHVTHEWAATRKEFEDYSARTREILGDRASGEAEAHGRMLALDRAVELALEVAESPASGPATAPVEPLTPRELEVTALIGAALNNAEIAEKLVISKRTVEKHVASIRAKLDVTERAQIVLWAVENGLVQIDP